MVLRVERQHRRCPAGVYERAVRLSGLPWSCTPEELAGFLLVQDAPYHPEQCVLVHNRAGDGFFRCRTHRECSRALGRKGERLGPRFVEVFPSTGAEADQWARVQKSRKDGAYRNVVGVRGLPWEASTMDVAEFFMGRGTNPDLVRLAEDHRNGRPNGEAFVTSIAVSRPRR